MKVADTLRSGFIRVNQRLRMLLFDLLWKLLHLVSIVVLLAAAGAWLILNLAQYKWQGPELTPSNPILLAMALAELWNTYSGTLAWLAIGVIASTIALWIAFEALFRGGAERFWIYAGTRIAFLVILFSAGVILAMLTAYEGLQSGIVSVIILLGIWWIVSTAETLIRRDALDLLAVHLPVVCGALASLLGIQLLLSAAAVAMLGFSLRMLFHSSDPVSFLASALLMVSIVIFWTVIHSYLVVVRYSTIDIMRDNVVEA